MFPPVLKKHRRTCIMSVSGVLRLFLTEIIPEEPPWFCGSNLIWIIPAEGDMKKNFFSILSLFLIILFFAGCSSEKENKVVVYAYDSFCSEWGPGPQLEKLFEEKTGYDLEILSVGDGAQVLAKAAFEKDDPQSDVLVGIDNQLYKKALNLEILSPYKPKGSENLKPEILFSDRAEDWFLTPYDWSSFAIIYDTESSVPAPESLMDLTKEIYRKKLILMDPRTSTPGLGFLTWTKNAFGDRYLEFWENLKPSVLTMAPGWDSGYGLFTAGEAPLVISYTTSPAYHIEYDEPYSFRALVFPEAAPLQVEGAGLTKNSKNPEGGKAFIDFLISAEGQEILPLTQWMYPANKNIELPECYKTIEAPENIFTEMPDDVDSMIEEVLTVLGNE